MLRYRSEIGKILSTRGPCVKKVQKERTMYNGHNHVTVLNATEGVNCSSYLTGLSGVAFRAVSRTAYPPYNSWASRHSDE